MHRWLLARSIERNENAMMSFEGGATTQTGEFLWTVSWLTQMNRWSLGWGMEINEDVIVSDQGASIAPKG